MKIFATVILILATIPSWAYAADVPAPRSAAVTAPRDAAGHQAPPQEIVTEEGNFRLKLVPVVYELKPGPNSLDLALSDRLGNPVEGARLSVTPWMPTMGHGVWEKPVVSERGGGSYHVDNITIIMGGLWELRVSVKKGNLSDRGAFSFTVHEPESGQQEPEKPREGYQRSLASYRVPDVTLVNQDGRQVELRTLLESGKPVVLDFIFTTCTTVCPILSAGFANLQRELGGEARKVQLVSITIDPDNDLPEQLKRYRERFGGGPGWEFLTGTREEVGRVLKAFDAFVLDKMSHEPLYLLHAPGSDHWVRIRGLIKKSDLLAEYRKLEQR